MMRSGGVRLGLLAALIVAAVVLFIVLKNDNSNESSDTSRGLQVLTVNDGQPVGGVKKLTYNKGDRVQLEVRLNQPEEEIHVHGYEIEKPAEHSPVRFSFPANIDGVFEIEVHRLDDTEGPIAELHVNP
jgi:FtsP/CotA-like multicopper oxidase with cupredoxin domain